MHIYDKTNTILTVIVTEDNIQFCYVSFSPSLSTASKGNNVEYESSGEARLWQSGSRHTNLTVTTNSWFEFMDKSLPFVVVCNI